MTILGKDILILNKNNGTICRINNGTTLDAPLTRCLLQTN
jgi:hypothetical protein